MAVTIHSLFPCLKLIDKHRDDLEEISADAVISYAKDGGVGILIDCDNALAVLHTGEMLDSAGDTASDVNAGTYGLACLSNLMIGGDVTCFNGSAACADNSAEGKPSALPTPLPPATITSASIRLTVCLIDFTVSITLVRISESASSKFALSRIALCSGL